MQQVKFVQTSGKLYADGKLISLAFSGNGAGLNNPDYQHTHNVGVLPAGHYDAQKVNAPSKGPIVWMLTPAVANNMYGRSGFMVHWDNHAQDFTASDGCIVPTVVRAFYLLESQFELEVVEKE